ncbi:Mlp family lipoprotein (plasmid) [Borrelia miyamotoi]|uniref:Mlp family lipoprotein n=1 Tax=Borrelia miyamotoi TaxID=47466 RepID=A0AAQ3CLW5_9SPIR|nr:Mlp family lipoprotein [Borrelia miyamotoi]ATQ15320.1 Mlp family lipoprotein [Borrelia miyamotoi]ATQ16503.1 Mlp family lipoprotein [Borrelia miyamotoi]ATQ17650.1 Mlp family lipoprotein [Borrelia miyamotoi]ATQ18899.1 Mlp family lipoprotein [Borrelia miyamotoi]ATQ20143.1 Mlp family lipoprotein [Borrelia miyamotoi]
MNKNISYLIIICSMLLLYSCGDYNPIPEENNQKNGYNIALSADEQQKFNALKGGLDTIIKYLQNQLINNPRLETNKKNQYQKIINKYPDFIEWLSNNPDKQKELASDFVIVYEFLNEKRVQQASNLTNEQLIINTLNCAIQSQNNKCNDNDYVYDEKENIFFKTYFHHFFHDFLIPMNNTKTNEEIFESMKLEPYREIYNLIGMTRYEDKVRKTLNHNQKKGLDLLKEALISKKILYGLLISNIDKIKAVLNHIYSELEKCNRNNVKESSFKNTIIDYFDVINNKKLDEFQEKVKSGCQ